ncbi:MAG: hypothetical protein LBS21_01685 [Clostridiales bacterium]|jgi:hypothetical protein|nr:hypothetical protein [Clostridiales bacterium]
MASKKDLQRQERRVKNMNRKILIGVASFVLVAGLVAAGIIFVPKLLNNLNNNNNVTDLDTAVDPNAGTAAVATIDGNAVSEYEFVYHFMNQVTQFQQIAGEVQIWDMDFDGTTAEELAKQRTLETVRLTRECARRAKEEGLEPKPEELTDAQNNAESYVSTLPPHLTTRYGLTAQRMKELLHENIYSSLLFEKYTADYVPESADYEAELTQLIADEQKYWQDKAVAEGDTVPFTEQELSEIATNVEASLLLQYKNRYFETIFTPWIENMAIEINHEVYDTITVDSLYTEAAPQ